MKLKPRTEQPKVDYPSLDHHLSRRAAVGAATALLFAAGCTEREKEPAQPAVVEIGDKPPFSNEQRDLLLKKPDPRPPRPRTLGKPKTVAQPTIEFPPIDSPDLPTINPQPVDLFSEDCKPPTMPGFIVPPAPPNATNTNNTAPSTTERIDIRLPGAIAHPSTTDHLSAP